MDEQIKKTEAGGYAVELTLECGRVVRYEGPTPEGVLAMRDAWMKSRDGTTPDDAPVTFQLKSSLTKEEMDKLLKHGNGTVTVMTGGTYDFGTGKPESYAQARERILAAEADNAANIREEQRTRAVMDACASLVAGAAVEPDPPKPRRKGREFL